MCSVRIHISAVEAIGYGVFAEELFKNVKVWVVDGHTLGGDRIIIVNGVLDGPVSLISGAENDLVACRRVDFLHVHIIEAIGGIPGVFVFSDLDWLVLDALELSGLACAGGDKKGGKCGFHHFLLCCKVYAFLFNYNSETLRSLIN